MNTPANFRIYFLTQFNNMKLLNFIFQLAITLLVLIAIEGAFTLGMAFNFDEYNWVAYLAQICLLIVCIKTASLDWNAK